MREIKFRVWSNELNKMIYPDDKGWFNSCFIGENGFYQTCQLGVAVDLNGTKLEIMQFTGLKDKNGNNIYEGDIVKTHDQNNVIKYEYGSFMIVGLHKDKYERNYSRFYDYLIDSTIPNMAESRFDGVTTNLEIIGNIYQNPELLGAETNGKS